MAKKRSRGRSGIIFTVLGAAVIGGAIGVVLYHDPGTPLPDAPEVEFIEPYDDDWGKRPSAVASCEVTHILVKVDENRSAANAKKTIEQLWHLYKNNPTQSFWKDMQVKNNEDTADVHAVFRIPAPPPGLVAPFVKCAKWTKPGYARICKSKFGFHLIRTKGEDDK